MSLAGVALRPIRASDDAFLRKVYAQSRERELARVDWSPQARRAFLDGQFDAQHTHYQRHWPAARFDVIERDGTPIGRLYVGALERELRLIDIALLRDERGRGVGGALVAALQDEAGARGSRIVLHVEPDNPARELYVRLGFRERGDEGAYVRMDWRP